MVNRLFVQDPYPFLKWVVDVMNTVIVSIVSVRLSVLVLVLKRASVIKVNLSAHDNDWLEVY